MIAFSWTFFFSERLILCYLNFERKGRVALYMFTDNILSLIFSFDLTLTLCPPFIRRHSCLLVIA